METHEIDIEITRDGQVKIHVQGAKGPRCLEYAKLFQEQMGQVGKVSETMEMYEPPAEATEEIHQHL
jgi:hypothetical protein